MKKFNLNPSIYLLSSIALVLFLSCGDSFPPSNLPQIHLGNLSINTAAELRQFRNDNITVVNGDLIIGTGTNAGASDIIDLADLYKLERVAGRLRIGGTQLTSLEGLDSLQIAGEFMLTNNPLLENLDHLEQLKTESLVISFHERLNSLQGLNAMEGSLELLQINSCPNLNSLIGLEFLESVNRLVLVNNNGLNSLQGLNSLETVNHSMEISSNPVLKNLVGLEALNTNTGVFRISENDQLESLEGIENATSIFSFNIRKNPQLTDIQALSGHSQLVDLILEENTALRSLEGLQNLTVMNDLSIIKMNGLTDLGYLNNLEQVRHLTIEKNENLLNLDGFSSLVKSGTTFRIESNPKLTDFCGLQTLVNSADFGGQIAVRDNAYNPEVVDIRAGDCKEN